MKRKVIETADGFGTLAIDEMAVTYHSRHGAVWESTHVFINAGLDYYHHQHPEHDTIKVFEMGLGTGLNVLLSCEYAHTYNVGLEYTSLEKYPLGVSDLQGLSYATLMNGDGSRLLNEIHSYEWGSYHQLTDIVSFCKIESGLESYNSDVLYDLVYYDAFAPRAQPELWTVETFKKVLAIMNKKGVMVTYCSKGDVRRAIIDAGFSIEKLQGPPGKREMLRATKQ